MASRLNTIADAAVTIIAAAIAANAGDATTVERTYLPEILSPDFAAELASRKVYVSGMGYSQVGIANRAEDLNEYVLRFIVVNKFTDPGDPTKAWTDAQIDWVEQFVYDALSDARGFRVSNAWPETADMAQAYNAELLAEDRLFFSDCYISFRRDE